MASKTLRFHPQAEQEYLAALAWYRDRSLVTAGTFKTAVDSAIEKVRTSPQRWPIYAADFRKYTLRKFPFSLIYEDLQSEIVVFAVAHGHRLPGYWKDRRS
jgi:hypothetical protein